MGTKAVFTIKEYPYQIIGMTYDGSIHNLTYIAKQCYKVAKQLKVLTKFKKLDTEIIKQIQEKIVNNHGDWLFLDKPNNPEWITYSAILSIKNKTLDLYDGYNNLLKNTISVEG